MPIPRRALLAFGVAAGAASAAAVAFGRGRIALAPPAKPRTVSDVVSAFGPAAEARLRPRFTSAGVAYPPAEIALLALKAERRVELWARGAGALCRVRDYAVLAASGGPGPKLKEGDKQVPEGVYRIDAMNPNSRFHLSLRLDYPNARDRAQAAREGRTGLGGDIFVHGGAASIGCIALGDPAIEELFVLVARVGADRARVLVAPRDLRVLPPPRDERPWVAALYADLAREMAAFT